MKGMPLLARGYILVVGLSAAILLALVCGRADRPEDPQILALFALLTVLGELRLIRAPLGSEGVDLTFSTAFAFAILMSYGVAYAAAASVAASLLSDVIGRKVWWKAVFNAGQFVLVSIVAGAVFQLVGGKSHLDPITAFSTPREIAAAGVAAITYFGANTVLLSTAMGLALDAPIFRLMRQESKYQVVGSLGMFGLAPIAVVTAGRTIWLLPVLLIPLGVAYRSTVVSIEKEHQALHDSLTGLPNRELFRQRAIEAIAAARRSAGRSTAVMLIDLDRFKEINDTLGHGTGDMVLQELGPRLLAAIGDGCTIARLGGDEFGVILPELTDVAEAEASAVAVLEVIRDPMVMHGLDLEIGASIGIAFQGQHGDDADTLIQRADIAMYSAKESGSGHAIYTSMLDHTSPMQLSLVSELRQAIESSALVVYYQPKVSVATGIGCGAEALVRWNHPARGLVPPDEFVPIAEQSGLIRDLTRFVLREAIEANSRWRRMGHDLSINVNISARTLHDLDLPTLIAGLIDREHVPPSRVVLEITESTIMADPTSAIAALEELRAIGVEVSMDDYGTGHSSLAQLKTLPVDELKLDKSFITHMTAASSDALIAKSAIDLAHRLGLRVVAEGVETPETWELLCSMDCDEVQGYFFSRPIPEERFVDWIMLNRQRNAARASTSTGGSRSPSRSALQDMRALSFRQRA